MVLQRLMGDVGWGSDIQGQMIRQVRPVGDLFAVLTKNLAHQVKTEQSLGGRYFLSPDVPLYFLIPFKVIPHGDKFALNQHIDHKQQCLLCILLFLFPILSINTGQIIKNLKRFIWFFLTILFVNTHFLKKFLHQLNKLTPRDCFHEFLVALSLTVGFLGSHIMPLFGLTFLNGIIVEELHFFWQGFFTVGYRLTERAYKGVLLVKTYQGRRMVQRLKTYVQKTSVSKILYASTIETRTYQSLLLMNNFEFLIILRHKSNETLQFLLFFTLLCFFPYQLASF